jgi:hypothetical protein
VALSVRSIILPDLCGRCKIISGSAECIDRFENRKRKGEEVKFRTEVSPVIEDIELSCFVRMPKSYRR